MALSTLGTGLVGYWGWDEASGDALDLTGWGANGVITDGGRDAGKIGTGFRPSLATGKTTVASTLALTAMTYVSVQAWVNLDKAFSAMWGAKHIIAQKTLNETGVDAGWFLGSLDGSSNVSFRVMDAAGSTYTATYAEAATSGWVHYVGVFDGTYVRLYRNGTQVAQTFVSGVLGWDVNQALTIGTGIEGVIDEVAVWKRALTTGEITTLYAAPGVPKHPCTVLYPYAVGYRVDDIPVTFSAPPARPAALTVQSIPYLDRSTADPSAPPAVMPKAPGEAWAAGAMLYWDAAAGLATANAAGNSPLGAATAPAEAGSTVAVVQVTHPPAGTALGVQIAPVRLPAILDTLPVFQPPLSGGPVAYPDPNLLLVSVIADMNHLVHCTLQAGPSTAYPMMSCWSIELIPGSVYIRVAEKYPQDFRAGQRLDHSYFQVPEGYDFRNLHIRAELHSPDFSQFWYSEWFTMTGDNFYNPKAAPLAPLEAAVDSQIVRVVGVPDDGIVNVISDLFPIAQASGIPDFDATYGFWSVLKASCPTQPTLRNIYAARPQLDHLSIGVIEMVYTRVYTSGETATKRYQLRILAS